MIEMNSLLILNKFRILRRIANEQLFWSNNTVAAIRNEIKDESLSKMNTRKLAHRKLFYQKAHGLP